MKTYYSLPIIPGSSRHLASGWLTIAVGFLLASGVYPLLLALARTTYEMPWKDFFYTALVLHVDFTVLWWLLAIAGVFWSLNEGSRWPGISRIAMLLFVLGGVFAGVAPLLADANPLTNNYVPMLENRWFFKGLMLLGGGLLLLVLRELLSAPYAGFRKADGESTLRFGIWTASMAALVAIVALAWTYFHMPAIDESRTYYETLFWAGGHVLQYAHTALMVVAWLWLATICGADIPLSPRLVMLLFLVGVASVFLTPLAFVNYELTDPGFFKWFVWLMQDGNGVAAFVVGGAVIWAVLRGCTETHGQSYLKAALLFSILLFGVGGVLGLFIGESSTLITAHYHGSIVAVTMAFMAMTYYWLPLFGYEAPNFKWARIQVYAYATGQLIHIIGLAWGGGHGMKRKVVGTTQDIGVQAFVTPQDLVGLGGVVAVLSGILFAAVVLPVFFRGRAGQKQAEG